MTAYLRRLLACLLPAYGKHRAAAAPKASPAPAHRRPHPLPRHKSPYARDAAQAALSWTRPAPYAPTCSAVTGVWREGEDSPERQAQAERRWVLDMALRGMDVGPVVIHGVRLPAPGTGTRMPRSAVA